MNEGEVWWESVQHYLARKQQDDERELARVLAIRTLQNDGWSLRLIGLALGLSHERIRQLSTFPLTAVEQVE